MPRLLGRPKELELVEGDETSATGAAGGSKIRALAVVATSDRTNLPWETSNIQQS